MQKFFATHQSVTNHRDVIDLLPIRISDHIAVCKLQGDDEVEEGREMGEEEEEWLYTEEDVANLVDAEVTQALKLATAPLEARSVLSLS